MSGGENVYSREVEDALLAHPSVTEAAVIGVPDARWGEAVVAYVVTSQDAATDETALIAHCRTLIAGYKRPQKITFVTELPRLPHGKVDKEGTPRSLLGGTRPADFVTHIKWSLSAHGAAYVEKGYRQLANKCDVIVVGKGNQLSGDARVICQSRNKSSCWRKMLISAAEQ